MRKCFVALVSILLASSLVPLFSAGDPFSFPVSTVILDAGHGGHDPGASASYSFSGGTINESDLTLDIAKRVLALLKVEKPALQVVMTRTDDTYVSLAQRSQVAYSAPLPPKSSALFVSIHINSATTSDAVGFEILTKRQAKQVSLLDEQTPLANIALFASLPSLELNRFLNQRNLYVAGTFAEVFSEKLITSRSRGIKERDLYVLNASRVPSVLVEVGFLSNEDEAQKILSPTWRQLVAHAITEAVIRCI